MKKIRSKNQTLTSILVFVLLTHILFNTKDLMTRIVIIPFQVFSLGLFLKNIFIIFGKRNISIIMEKIYVIAFFVYYFGFLIYWDYTSIIIKIICRQYFLC